ncbi:Acyltransferase family protein [Crateriforma conspicua]|nr:Acyltransferase family protein [Crateriforma conspicua]
MKKAKKRRVRPKSSRKSSASSQSNVPGGRSSEAATLPPRNAALDTLRGLAIVLMLVDHAAAYWFDVRIELTSVRLITRLSMPLFCLLLGYFLPTDRRFRAVRLLQILAAAVAVNLVYWPLNHQLEILASLLLAAVVGTAMGRTAPLMLASILFYRLDPVSRWFDYQPTLVFALVGQGAMLRRFGIGPAIASGLALLGITISGHWIRPTDTHRFVVWFSLPATILVGLGRRFPDFRVIGLDWLGRHPLSIYVAHFYVIAAIAWALGGN